MKRHTYPHFTVVGIVSAHEHGSTSPAIEVKASCYISYDDEAYSGLVRAAKWKLERLGAPKERLEALYFEGVDITDRWALDAKGVRREYGVPVEAFVDSRDLKKRDVLIRQRRLIPYCQTDMLAIYGPAKTTAPETQAEGVPA
jgi:hypothetical protein